LDTNLPELLHISNIGLALGVKIYKLFIIRTITTYFPSICRALGKRPKSSVEKLNQLRESIIDSAPGQLSKLFEDVLPPEAIPRRKGERTRAYNSFVTTWSMIEQALERGTLRGGVIGVNSSREAKGLQKLSSNSAALCKARQRLPESSVEMMNRQVVDFADRICGDQPRVLLVDGTGLQISDSKDNQDEYPQPTNQKAGCGFPVMQQVALLDIRTNAIVASVDSPMNVSETGMFQVEILDHVRADDTVVADSAYCSYLNFALLQEIGAKAVMDLHAGRKKNAGKGEDITVSWQKPRNHARPEHIHPSQWDALPQTIDVRYIRFKISRNGFRSQEMVVVTNDLNSSPEQIAELYMSRWQIELCFRDIKITMGLDFIRTKNASVARKILRIGLIAHNLLRIRMHEALMGRRRVKISFKGALEVLNRLSRQAGKLSRRKVDDLRMQIVSMMCDEVFTQRPGRQEPRVRKRRPKNFPLMKKPRAEYANYGTCPAPELENCPDDHLRTA